MNKYQIAVIGGGVVGAEIARFLTAKSLSVCLIEKECDIANGGATKANSGIVHAGFDCHVGTLKAKLNVRGSELYPALAKRLGVELINCGAIVVGRECDREKVQALYDQGIENGVTGLEIIEREQIKKYAKTIHKDITCGLLARTSSIISPYITAIAMAEEAKLNGCDFFFDSQVIGLKKENGIFNIQTSTQTILADCVINASGGGASAINKMIGAEQFEEKFVRGEYLLLDLCERDFVSATIFPLPTSLGKGVLCSPTVHGNIIVGPTAISCEQNENVVSPQGLDYILSSMGVMIENVNTKKNIRVFAGNRTTVGDDFLIKKSQSVEGYIYLGGICSPGLSSAPAIAEYVGEMVNEMGFELCDKEDIVFRKPYNVVMQMDDKQLNELIAKDSRYGKIVCRCEKISEGEILEAINSPLSPKTVDGVKRRVRAGMGRCQGGFCMPRVMELIAKENNMPIEEVTKFGKGSEILTKGNFEKEDV